MINNKKYESWNNVLKRLPEKSFEGTKKPISNRFNSIYFKIFGDKLTPRLQRLVQCKHCKRVIAYRTFDIHLSLNSIIKILVKFHPTKFSNLPIANLINQELNNQKLEDFMNLSFPESLSLTDFSDRNQRNRTDVGAGNEQLEMYKNIIGKGDDEDLEGCTPIPDFYLCRNSVIKKIRESSTVAPVIKEPPGFDPLYFFNPTLKEIEEQKRVAAEKAINTPQPVQNVIEPPTQPLPVPTIPETRLTPVPLPLSAISEDFNRQVINSEQRTEPTPINKRPQISTDSSYVRSTRPNQLLLNRAMPYQTGPRSNGARLAITEPSTKIVNQDTRIAQNNGHNMAHGNEIVRNNSQFQAPIQGYNVAPDLIPQVPTNHYYHDQNSNQRPQHEAPLQIPQHQEFPPMPQQQASSQMLQQQASSQMRQQQASSQMMQQQASSQMLQQQAHVQMLQQQAHAQMLQQQARAQMLQQQAHAQRTRDRAPVLIPNQQTPSQRQQQQTSSNRQNQQTPHQPILDIQACRNLIYKQTYMNKSQNNDTSAPASSAIYSQGNGNNFSTSNPNHGVADSGIYSYQENCPTTVNYSQDQNAFSTANTYLNPNINNMSRVPIHQQPNMIRNFNSINNNYNQMNPNNNSSNSAGVSQADYYNFIAQNQQHMIASSRMSGSHVPNQNTTNQQCSPIQYVENIQGQCNFNGTPIMNPTHTGYNQMANQNNGMHQNRFPQQYQQIGYVDQPVQQNAPTGNQNFNINQIPVGLIDTTGTPFREYYEMAVNNQGKRFLISYPRNMIRNNTFGQAPNRQMINNPTPVQNYSSMSTPTNGLLYLTQAGDPKQQLYQISNMPNYQGNGNIVVQLRNPNNPMPIQNPNPSNTPGLQQQQLLYYNSSGIPSNLVNNNRMYYQPPDQPNPQMMSYPPGSYPGNIPGNYR